LKKEEAVYENIFRYILFEVYYREADTYIIENIFLNNIVDEVFLSELTKIEFDSTVWKKLRTQEINEVQAQAITKHFEKDINKYIFVPIDNIIVEQARILMSKYGKQGLRTLDSIQLSVAVSLTNNADLFVTADKLLESFFKLESLSV